MISLDNVTFRYGSGASEPVLQSAHLDVGRGLTLVLGPNGCGKSTLMKIAAGVEKPDAGNVSIDELDLWEHEVAARRYLAYVPEHPDLTPYASLREVLTLVCRIRNEPLEVADEVAHRAGIASFQHRSVRELSQGQRRRALMAAAWIGSPRILVLDEPLEAMDGVMRRQIETWVDDHVERDHVVLLSTHAMESFVGLAARAVSVRDGRIETWDPLPGEPKARRALLTDIAIGAVETEA